MTARSATHPALAHEPSVRRPLAGTSGRSCAHHCTGRSRGGRFPDPRGRHAAAGPNCPPFRFQCRTPNRQFRTGCRSLRHVSSCPPMNDDQSPLTTLISCIECAKTMRIEKIDPDGDSKDIIQYRCEHCGRIERLRLVRRTWPPPSQRK